MRSLSGPSGKVLGSRFVLDETRSRFVYPQDKSLVIYFEWEAPPGNHVLTGIWKAPDGRTASISPDVKMETQSSQLKCYWTYQLTPGMSSGVWTFEVRIDGQPAGSHPFEVISPELPQTPSEPRHPARPRLPTLDDIYRTVGESLVWVHKLDDTGRHVDTALGFVVASNVVATAFQAIDSAQGLEVQFPNGTKASSKELWGWQRTQDWALIKVETGAAPVLKRGDAKQVAVGQRLIVFNVETGLARVIGGVDISGRRTIPGFGERIQLSPSPSTEASGGPLLDEFGRVVGIVGGSLAPGARFNRRDMSVSPGLWNMMNVQNAATPISVIPEGPFKVATTLQTLAASGALTPPIAPLPAFLYGGTSNASTKKGNEALPSDVSEFSRKDPEIWVYAMLQRKDKIRKGVFSAKVYDPLNRLRITVTPKTIALRDVPLRTAFSFSPATLEAGFYRVDLIWDDQPVWRTFFSVTD